MDQIVKMNVNVLIVDDHPLLLNGVSQMLARQPTFTIVGEASSGKVAVEQAVKLAPDLVLMDIQLPDMNGIEATERILAAVPAAKIVVFSADGDRSTVDAALEAGVSGYVLKESAVDELIKAVHLALAGKLYLSPEVSAHIFEDYRKSLDSGAAASKPGLSDREKQLLKLIADGKRNKEIAMHLHVEPKSIETYRSRLMKKLNCASPAELVRYAIREGIVVP